MSIIPEFYSVSNILATQEKVPCTFLQNVPKLGTELNPSSETSELASGSNLELPLWLANDLAVAGRNPVVNIDMPKIFQETYQEILKADAKAVDLHKLNMYFYEFGSEIKKFDRRNQVGYILIHAFKTRFKYLMDLAENADDNPHIVQKLENLEKKLFKECFEARHKLNNWLKESGVPIETAKTVVNHKKRKRIEMEQD